jgi:hypothetical protein
VDHIKAPATRTGALPVGRVASSMGLLSDAIGIDIEEDGVRELASGSRFVDRHLVLFDRGFPRPDPIAG